MITTIKHSPDKPPVKRRMAATQLDECQLEEEKFLENSFQQDPIRIAVLGATGVGKSTLCNLLCGTENAFEMSDWFDSCTDEVKSQQFIYETDTGDQKCNPVKYEVIDCPGFFDTDVVLSKMNESKMFNDNIKKCIHLTKNGISGYLLLIPHERMSAYHAASIRFIMEYFPPETKKYVWLIMTKSGQLTKEGILNQMENSQSKKKEATKLLQKFVVIDIDRRLIPTECVNVENTGPYRESILQAVYETHVENDGPYTGNGIWNALQSQLEAYEKQQAEQQKQQAEQQKQKQKLQQLTKQNEEIIQQNKNNEIWVYATTAVGVIVAAIVLGYVIRRHSFATRVLKNELTNSQRRLYTATKSTRQLKNKLTNSQRLKQQLLNQNSKLENELTKSKRLLDTAEKSTGQLLNQNSKLENKLTNSKRLLDTANETTQQLKNKLKEDGCFSGSNALLIKRNTEEIISEIQLCELKVGDYVQAKTKEWTKVWFINKHYGRYNMIRLYFSKVDHISLSAEHLLYVAQINETCLRRADEIEIDDIVFITNKNGEFNEQKIVSIDHTVEQHAYSPITMEGSIVIAGVLASSYTKSVENAKRLHESAAIFRLISNINSDVAAVLTDFFYNIIFKGMRCLNLEFMINAYSSPFIVIVNVLLLLLFGAIVNVLIRLYFH